MPFKYPIVRRDESQKELLHGVEIRDPYRWLEDPDSQETKEFVDKQNEVTMPYIESCKERDLVQIRLTELWDYPKYTCPYKRGEKYYYSHNTGIQNQYVMYTQDTLDGESKVFFDPNLLTADGTTSISTNAFSEDGKWFAYGLSDAGSDWVYIKIRNVETGVDCDEVLLKCKFTSIAWTHDNLGFFYMMYPDQSGTTDGTEVTANENEKTYYHRINTPQSDDILVIEFPEHPRWRSRTVVSDCGKYLHVLVSEFCHDNMWFYCKLDQKIEGPLKLTTLIEKPDAEYEFIANDDDIIYMRTNKNAANYKIVRVDLKEPEEDKWTDLIPAHESDVLDSCDCVNNDVLVVGYMRNVISIIELRKLSDGSLIKSLEFPIGSIYTSRVQRKQTEIFFYLTSFLTPGIMYYYNFETSSEPKVFRKIQLNKFDESQFEVKQVSYTSKDGKTKVPMFLIHKKGLQLNGDNPCLLYGYGGFNISMTPGFSISRLIFLSHLNGIIATPNLRGGGEFGQKWHDGGRLLNKQNTFDDFQAAAEYLVKERYTNSKKLIIQGGSNGGLLIGACINQRPDLFGCAIAHVGVMDMLRFHKFTIGSAWISDYGNPDEEKHFHNVVKFSPLHNISSEQKQFPATLLLTGDHDDRVVPLHSLKFIAELQHKLGEKVPNVPLLIRIDTKAGHGAGKPTTKTIEEQSDIYSFVINSLGLNYEH